MTSVLENSEAKLELLNENKKRLEAETKNYFDNLKNELVKLKKQLKDSIEICENCFLSFNMCIGNISSGLNIIINKRKEDMLDAMRKVQLMNQEIKLLEET